jgi:vacuolar protein sorting-associated protein 13A/C
MISVAEEKQTASFVTQLVTKIVDNLQITIKNIHIRYEDRISLSKGVGIGASRRTCF